MKNKVLDNKSVKKKKKKKKKYRYDRIVIFLLIISIFGFIIAKFAINGILSLTVNSQPIDEKLLSMNSNLNDRKVKNILLLGVDSRVDSYVGTRSDAIMILTINEETKKIKMTSIMRDTYLYDTSRMKFDKINHAYAFGGPVEIISSINSSLDLNISDYIVVNFGVTKDLVDYVGGVEVDVQEYILPELNKYILETNKVLGEHANTIHTTGKVKLNGVQAISYSRIRHMDTDSMRAQRQRIVLNEVMTKLKTSNPATLISVANRMLKDVKTSLSNDEIISLAKKVNAYRKYETEQLTFPKDSEGKKIDGVYYEIPKTLLSNVELLHEFIYENHEYSSSSYVQRYSNQIYEKAYIYN